MNCPSCKKEIVPDSVFCSWCSDFVPSSGKGRKANLFRRWVALALDPLIAVVLYLVGVGIVGSISKDLGIVAAIGLPIVYLVWFLGLLRQGLTPGKKVMGLQVVDHQTGTIPGFGKDVRTRDRREVHQRSLLRSRVLLGDLRQELPGLA